jgi:hypothetical protein
MVAISVSEALPSRSLTDLPGGKLTAVNRQVDIGIFAKP